MRAAEAETTLDLPLPKLASGKVREVFDLGDGRLLFVATDRISAFDVIMRQGVPDKGRMLTAMSHFWFEFLSAIPNHLSADTSLPAGLADEAVLSGRSMIVDKLEMLPLEFVVRGYLAGSGFKDYQRSGSVCGVPLPEGMRESDRLPEPIFTPSTKATTGHDENITEEQAVSLVGAKLLSTAKQMAIDIYAGAAEHALAKGIILADTKFEFGLRDGEVVLADEVLTPDSSRFWPEASWVPGSSPPSYDKQYLRDWLDEQSWDHSPPPPDLPDDVLAATRARYVEAYEKISGRSFDSYLASGA